MSNGLISPEVASGLKRGLLFGVVICALALPPIHLARTHWPGRAVAPSVSAVQPSPQQPRFAEFGSVEPSPEVRRIADWAADSRDNGNLDFIVLDKRGAHVYVFDRNARLLADTPVLLGAAEGDDAAEGVAQKALHQLKAEEKTTPAGRFVGESGRNSDGEDVFWVDYASAVSMHRVRQIEASERRLERLASPTAADNRISYGCINMPADFYDSVMVPIFRGKRALVYVLPEVRRFEEVFPDAYDVAARHTAAARHASA